jgi:enoyl-CoA hydratase/carnithine racemase
MTSASDRWDDEVFARGDIRVREKDGVLTIELNRPEARNAQTPAMWTALAAVGAAVTADPADIAVVVIRGAGPSFSAGLDRRMFTPEGVPGQPSLATLISLPDGELDAAIADFQRAFTWQRTVRPLTIAAVHGHAIGAGFQLALACDLIIAAPDATFAMRETSLGLVPDLGGTGPLVRAVGLARATDICATGRFVDATEAERLGLVVRVADDLAAAVAAYAETITASPPGAVADLLPLLAAAVDHDPQEQLTAERRAQIARLRALTGGQG